jgi:hypothetical protein
METNRALTLLTNLHSALSGLNGHLIIADKNSSYPLLTYSILNTRPTRAKSFTTDGDIYSVQFSFFDDTSILNCLSLQTSANTALESLSAYFDVSNGNVTTLGNTEQNRFYQLVDVKDIEIIETI